MPLSHFHRHIIDISLTSITIHHWHCHIFIGISLTSISNISVSAINKLATMPCVKHSVNNVRPSHTHHGKIKRKTIRRYRACKIGQRSRTTRTSAVFEDQLQMRCYKEIKAGSFETNKCRPSQVSDLEKTTSQSFHLKLGKFCTFFKHFPHIMFWRSAMYESIWLLCL